MSKTRLFDCAALVSFLILLLALPAAARQWNPGSSGAALDYTQILHAKGNGEIVVIWWVVPETFASVPNSQPLQDVLSRYVVIGVADGHAGANGAMSYGEVADLKITDQTARSLSALPSNVTPPEVAQAISALQTIARQSLGPVGQGIRWFVFDGSTIHSCTPGKMSVPYGGETYTYDTPIPGCAK